MDCRLRIEGGRSSPGENGTKENWIESETMEQELIYKKIGSKGGTRELVSYR